MEKAGLAITNDGELLTCFLQTGWLHSLVGLQSGRFVCILQKGAAELQTRKPCHVPSAAQGIRFVNVPVSGRGNDVSPRGLQGQRWCMA